MRYTIPIAILLISACTPGVPTYTVSDVEFNGAPGSRAPHLAATPDGAVMSWWDRLEGRRYALRVAERRAGVWSDPRTVVEGDHFFVNWADFPSVTVMADGTWLAHWLEKTADATYAYHVRLATSRDRGATWSDAVTPHDDRSPTEHGFVSVEPWQGGAALVWLDGRQMAEWYEQGGPQGHSTDPRGSMTLRFTALGSDGSLGTDIPIDERTCECCQTALTAVPGALVAAYRDRSE